MFLNTIVGVIKQVNLNTHNDWAYEWRAKSKAYQLYVENGALLSTQITTLFMKNLRNFFEQKPSRQV